ncbi:hypothetical protein BDZ90DRAFT_251353 [Jaminaea rosea]|uniref:Prohibitin n=1 Tax=Jaminaea rosea TaxID=1569628 RepID=A0A316UTR6_9BASI|nr:hypothetical protein BDZ90DRAFT_251353 [Jaminaea rosea]PWN28679.1 hypothetical protein BDZ90DRAFT_251353 [Jaminaea rosea]
MSALPSLLNRLAVPLGVGFVALQPAIYDVDGGKRVVIFDRFSGVRDTVVGEGTHLLMPGIQRAIPMDIRVRPRTITTQTGSKDLQQVSLTLRVLSRPDVKALPRIYSNYGLDYDERILPSIANEVLKSVVAQFDASELITSREVASSQIRTQLVARASEFGILLEDLALTHLTFGSEFTRAVERKQIAQQEAERARFVVEQAEQERQAAVVRAEGEAEAAALISKALSSAGDGLLTLRRIETARSVAQELAQSRNVTYLPHGGSSVLLNMQGQGGQ